MLELVTYVLNYHSFLPLQTLHVVTRDLDYAISPANGQILPNLLPIVPALCFLFKLADISYRPIVWSTHPYGVENSELLNED